MNGQRQKRKPRWMPKKNEKDIDEISPEIKKGLKIVFVEQMKDVLDVAFVKK